MQYGIILQIDQILRGYNPQRIHNSRCKIQKCHDDFHCHFKRWKFMNKDTKTDPNDKTEQYNHSGYSDQLQRKSYRNGGKIKPPKAAYYEGKYGAVNQNFKNSTGYINRDRLDWLVRKKGKIGWNTSNECIDNMLK